MALHLFRIRNIPGLEDKFERDLICRINSYSVTNKDNSSFMVLEIPREKCLELNKVIPGKTYAIKFQDEDQAKYTYYTVHSFEVTPPEIDEDVVTVTLGVTYIEVFTGVT